MKVGHNLILKVLLGVNGLGLEHGLPGYNIIFGGHDQGFGKDIVIALAASKLIKNFLGSVLPLYFGKLSGL